MLRCKNYHLYVNGRCPICIAARAKIRREQKAALKARYDAQNRERRAEKDRKVREAAQEQHRQHCEKVRRERVERGRLYQQNRKNQEAENKIQAALDKRFGSK